MSSLIGLPTQGSDLKILITKVHLHPNCGFVEFWGNFCHESIADYECLAKDLQSPGNALQEFEGNPGDQCLVRIAGTWYRSRIVSRNGLKYTLFLIDKGNTHHTTTGDLAWGKKTHFHLPPEVEYCVLANVVPILPENRWSPVAFDYLKSLSGKSVKAHVQDVLIAHRTFLLHIPCISRQMYEMGFAKKLSPDMFQDFVLMSLQSHSVADVPPETRQMSLGEDNVQLQKQELFMYPELPAGTIETVVVTDVTNPQRIFCQLKVFSKELNKLSEQITQCCEGRVTSCIVGPEMIGFPCATRGSDGRWYRSVLKQVCQASRVVEVLNIDYGTKQFVQMKDVRPLAAEFFRMPVVTYICSLYGIIDKGVGWTSSQIKYLRSLLLYKTVVAKFEYQSISEGVHYVTLYGDDNVNINDRFGSKESCLLESEKTLEDYALQSTSSRRQCPQRQELSQTKTLTPGQAVDGKEDKGRVAKLPVENLDLNSSHVAVVQHVCDPSEIWIQTQNYENELDELMNSIYHLYKDSENKYVVANPTVGLYCAAKAEDGAFYRATVAETSETKIKVFFVDYGNTEVVDRRNIRALPDKFKKLPCLGLKCTLAGVGPKDGRWSQNACEFFIKAVTNKTLKVHVTAKNDKGYVVQLTDPKRAGENDISTLMCCSGFAEGAETMRRSRPKMTTQSSILAFPQLPYARLTGLHRNNGISSLPLDTLAPGNNERGVPTFKEQMFPIGRVLDVTVSYIENPNDFWCQLVENSGQLKLLMHNMQAHYANSKFQPLVEMVCVARHPDNGMWYRALVIHKHETPNVDVLFVDYGQTETISLYDLRRISPDFLTLHGQAFRCSLVNPVDPTSATYEWPEEAVAQFQKFVETATVNFVILKCTVYAIMYSEQKIVFNVVDLETPFESISASMVDVIKNAPKKVSGPSFRLDTYYYSTHSVKTGTEEQVTVTCVNNVSQFYCQLERNADVIKDLRSKVRHLCHRLENVKLPTVFGTLCFAKYTDGQWYRGQIKATKPAILVHFVDYGDTIEVDKSDLLPVPMEANDIISVPVQAVVCSLSDVPANVPSEVNAWFEKSVTECKFRAQVMAREPDGNLLVELYHGKTQINSTLKKMFQIEMKTQEWVKRAPEFPERHAEKTLVPKQAVERKEHMQTINKDSSSSLKTTCQMRDGNMNLHHKPGLKPLRHASENGQKVKAAPIQLYRTPHQRRSSGETPNNVESGSKLAGDFIKPRIGFLKETKPLMKSNSPETESQKKSDEQALPKLADLPLNAIPSDMEAGVYISHCNSPLSFYVQLVRDEEELFSLAEKLNDPQSTHQADIQSVHPGDLVQAEFAEDVSWYRAVVREVHKDAMALVQFVDFGNTETIPISKMSRLDQPFLHIPMYSTHCMLSDAAALGKDEVLDPKVVAAFKEDICGNEENTLKCQFIRRSTSVWEVRLVNSGVKVMCKVPTRCSTDDFEITSEKMEPLTVKPTQTPDIRQVPESSQKSPLDSYAPCNRQPEILEGQTLEVYVTNVNDAQTFWCQLADSEELAKITSNVSEVGDAADPKHLHPHSLLLGAPCVALFSDDHLWYRAKVIDKNGDELSVLFVDYGNTAQVSVKDVREMPSDLMETPPQAFLCELEGFDAPHGSWDSGAVDEFSVLTTDKLLQLTVTRVTREDGNFKCFVQMEREGLVINEALKTWWKTSTTENKPEAVEPPTSQETAVQCDSTEDQLGYQEMDSIATCVSPQRDHNAGELVDPSGSEQRENLEDYIQSESSEESPEEERDPILSECLKETVSDEETNIASTTVVCQTKARDILPCDGGVDENIVHLPGHKAEQDILTLSCDESAVKTDEGTDVEGASVVDTSGPDTLSSPLDENLTETVDELDLTTTDLESLPGEECNADDRIFSDPNKQRDHSEVALARDNSLSSMTTVKMVPREAADPPTDISQAMKEVQAELLPSSVQPTCDASPEQEFDAGDEVLKEEVPCVATHIQDDLMAEEETSAQHEDTFSAPPAAADTAASEPHLDDEDEELSSSVEEDTLRDGCTDPNELSDDTEVTGARDDCLSSRTTEETVQNESPAPCGELHQDQSIALPSVTEPQGFTGPDMVMKSLKSSQENHNLIEEVICRLGDITLTDVCREPHEDADPEDDGQPARTPSEQSEVFCGDELQTETSSSADDPLEAQLANITHLSLIITDDADIQPAERQPEE